MPPLKAIRKMISGPYTMLPRWKDFQDCAVMWRWFFKGGPKPRFDRWTYCEKFVYVAEVGGSGINGLSGLLLWFPEFFALFLPGWVFNVALLVHGEEALLAVGFIFTIHFFNGHLRPEKFPMDTVIFTGRVTEREMQHERPDEYDRLVREGALERVRVDPPPRWLVLFGRTVGYSVVAIWFASTVLLVVILTVTLWIAVSGRGEIITDIDRRVMRIENQLSTLTCISLIPSDERTELRVAECQVTGD